MADAEYHVASYVIRTPPESAAAVARRIRSTPGLEVHAEERGRLVVTAEAVGVRELAEIADRLTTIDAVLAVDPIYHEYHEYAGGTDSPGNQD